MQTNQGFFMFGKFNCFFSSISAYIFFINNFIILFVVSLSYKALPYFIFCFFCVSGNGFPFSNLDNFFTNGSYFDLPTYQQSANFNYNNSNIFHFGNYPSNSTFRYRNQNNPWSYRHAHRNHYSNSNENVPPAEKLPPRRENYWNNKSRYQDKSKGCDFMENENTESNSTFNDRSKFNQWNFKHVHVNHNCNRNGNVPPAEKLPPKRENQPNNKPIYQNQDKDYNYMEDENTEFINKFDSPRQLSSPPQTQAPNRTEMLNDLCFDVPKSEPRVNIDNEQNTPLSNAKRNDKEECYISEAPTDMENKNSEYCEWDNEVNDLDLENCQEMNLSKASAVHETIHKAEQIFQKKEEFDESDDDIEQSLQDFNQLKKSPVLETNIKTDKKYLKTDVLTLSENSTSDLCAFENSESDAGHPKRDDINKSNTENIEYEIEQPTQDLSGLNEAPFLEKNCNIDQELSPSTESILENEQENFKPEDLTENKNRPHESSDSENSVHCEIEQPNQDENESKLTLPTKSRHDGELLTNDELTENENGNIEHEYHAAEVLTTIEINTAKNSEYRFSKRVINQPYEDENNSLTEPKTEKSQESEVITASDYNASESSKCENSKRNITQQYQVFDKSGLSDCGLLFDSREKSQKLETTPQPYRIENPSPPILNLSPSVKVDDNGDDNGDHQKSERKKSSTKGNIVTKTQKFHTKRKSEKQQKRDRTNISSNTKLLVEKSSRRLTRFRTRPHDQAGDEVELTLKKNAINKILTGTDITNGKHPELVISTDTDFQKIDDIQINFKITNSSTDMDGKRTKLTFFLDMSDKFWEKFKCEEKEELRTHSKDSLKNEVLEMINNSDRSDASAHIIQNLVQRMQYEQNKSKRTSGIDTISGKYLVTCKNV